MTPEAVRPLHPPPARWLPWLALLLLAVLGCNRGLWTPDEPREAEIGREMLLAPTLIPTLNGQRFIEKPPLYYWVLAGAYGLSGGPSVLAARAVSIIASLATLWLVYAWVSRARGAAAGMLSALMLATSEQFLVSSHWILLDPLLMLTTTLAAFCAWMLLAQDAGRPGLSRWRVLMYLALVLALWIKGPIGPLLVAVGLATYLLIERPAGWRRLAPFVGAGLMVLAFAALALAIYVEGGRAAIWEWAYVNQVQRLTHPGNTGHRQPLLYYVWTVPVAVLPWLPPLLEAFRPQYWRRGTRDASRVAAGDVGRFAALLSAGMVLLLSVSATKRETYLLPVLPLLFIWLGVRGFDWWQAWQQSAKRGLGVAGWGQMLLSCLSCLMPALALWMWSRQINPLLAFALAAGLACVAALLWYLWRDQRHAAGVCLLVVSVIGAANVLVLAPVAFDRMKNMEPFMRRVAALVPDRPLSAVHVDETLAAEVPFYTGRQVVETDPAALRAQAATGGALPEWLLVQDNHDGKDSALPVGYQLALQHNFGPRRGLALWHTGPIAGTPAASSEATP